MPPPDKIRPWLWMDCRHCDFDTQAEWAALRHEDETGHSMDWNGHPFQTVRVDSDSQASTRS